MAEQAGGKFSCHHLLVQVASGLGCECGMPREVSSASHDLMAGQQDASGRPLKARLLSALDIANGMIEATSETLWKQHRKP